MAITIKDIANAAQISAVTVSRILSNKEGHYSAATAAKVRKIAKILATAKILQQPSWLLVKIG